MSGVTQTSHLSETQCLCVHACVCVCVCVIDLGGAVEVETQSCCIFSQTAKSMQSGFEWKEYTLLPSDVLVWVCVWDPAGNPRRQSALGHYSSSVSAATINDNVVVALATNTRSTPFAFRERVIEKEYKTRAGGWKERQKDRKKTRKIFVFVFSLLSPFNLFICFNPCDSWHVYVSSRKSGRLSVCDISMMQLAMASPVITPRRKNIESI